jgi:hypothetical protein
MLAQSHFHASPNGGICIGRLNRRIYEQRGGPEHMRWFWSLYGMFGVPAELRNDGQAATLDEAKAQFETAWRRRSAWAQLTASTPRPPACLAPPRPSVWSSSASARMCFATR